MESIRNTWTAVYKSGLILGLLLGSPSLLAENKAPSIDLLAPLDKPQEIVSHQVIQFANWLDSFFGENRVYQETSRNYLKVGIQHFSEQGSSPSYDLKIKGKITLPRTEQRLKLMIESEAEEDVAENRRDTPLQALEDQKQSVALQYTPETTSNWLTDTDVGVRLRSRLDIFTRLRTRRLIEYAQWNLRASQSVYWYRTLGTGETSQLDLERKLGDFRLFRSTTFATWLNRNSYFDLGQEFSIFEQQRPYRAIVYQASVNGISQPNTHTTNYALSIRVRQQIHSNWLYFEINPAINFPREKNFTPVNSLNLKLEAIFGNF